jgi:hypothetical protein
MSRALILFQVLVLVLALAACQSAPQPEGQGAVDAQCNAICYAPCVDADGDTGVRWEADPDASSAWDVLGEDVTDQLTTKLRTCETRRSACVQCLERLEAEGVIRR